MDRDSITTCPGLQRFEGVSLTIDIAGFSNLADRLARLGPHGAEQLSVILNSYFGPMTEIAIDHGGDVIDFFGDGIIVLWHSKGNVEDCLCLAIQCGLKLQEEMRSINDDTGAPLRQRVAISVGEVLHLMVGGTNRKWYSMFCGEAIIQSNRLYRHSEPGEVIVSSEAWKLVGNHCVGTVQRTGNVLIHYMAEFQCLPQIRTFSSYPYLESLLERYVPDVLTQRIRMRHEQWLEGFRSITTIFVNISHVNIEAKHLLHRTQSVVSCVEQEVNRYEGSFEQLVTDDKGVIALIAFGLPLLTHEDDQIRALLAVLATHSRLAAQGIPVSIGMTTGRLFYGDTGGNRRRHAAIIGSTINLASRLMEAANGRILCDQETKSAADQSFLFSAPTLLRVKGHSQSVWVYHPRKRIDKETHRFGGSLIGRESEQKRLDNYISSAGNGSMLVVVQGEAGIGKSRLLAYVIVQAANRNILSLVSNGSVVERATPYYPWRRILIQILMGQNFCDENFMREELMRRVQKEERLVSWLPLLNDVLPLDIPDNGVIRQIKGAARAVCIHTLLGFLLKQLVAEQHVLLVFDDFHWFDEASASALDAIFETVPGLVVYSGCRPLDSCSVPTVVNLVNSAAKHTLKLNSLSRDAAAMLISEKLACAIVPDELTEFVTARTGGHPFYTEELLMALRGAKLIRVIDGRCKLSPTFPSAALDTIPSSLHGVIVSRIEKLPSAAHLLLKVASVIGQEFSTHMLRDLYPDSEDTIHLNVILEILEAEDLVIRGSQDGADYFAFRHIILQEVIYDLLPFALRQKLHILAAQWIEKNHQTRLEAFCPDLARHWERAGVVVNALKYLEKAGVLALEQYAAREAVVYISRCFALAELHTASLAKARRAKWNVALGDARHELREYHFALPCYERALALSGHPVPESRLALLLGLIKQLTVQVGLRIRTLKPLTPEAAHLEDVKRASHVYERVAEIAYFEDRPADLLFATLASLNLAESSQSIGETVDGFAALSIGLLQAGLPMLAKYYIRCSLQLAESEGTIGETAGSHLVNMVYAATQGHWPEVQSSAIAAGSRYLELGARIRWQTVQGIICFAYYTMGQFDKSERVLCELKKSQARDIPDQIKAWIHSADLVIALVKGTPSIELIARLQVIANTELNHSDRVLCLGLIAIALLRRGDRQEAIETAQCAMAQIARHTPTAWHITAGISGIAETYLSAWETERIGNSVDTHIKPLVHNACKALQNHVKKAPVSAPRAEILYGRYEFLCRRHSQSKIRWNKALKRAEALDMPYEAGLALYELGRCEQFDSAYARSHLRRACAIFERLGATYAHAKSRRILAKSAEHNENKG